MDHKQHDLNRDGNVEVPFFQRIVAFGTDMNKLVLTSLQVLMMLKGYIYT